MAHQEEQKVMDELPSNEELMLEFGFESKPPINNAAESTPIK